MSAPVKMLALPEDVVNKVVNYLSTRPLGEVIDMWSSIVNKAIVVDIQEAPVGNGKATKNTDKKPKLLSPDPKKTLTIDKKA